MPRASRSFSSEEFSAATSARSFTAAAFRCLAAMSRTLGGRRSQARRLMRVQKPSHMWLVTEQYFCTSYSLKLEITASGFSWPSTTLVCSAVYISDALIDAGAESKALNMEVHIGDTGTRILKPRRSSGELMGLVE